MENKGTNEGKQIEMSIYTGQNDKVWHIQLMLILYLWVGDKDLFI